MSRRSEQHLTKKASKGVPSIKQVLPAEKNKRSTSVLFVLLFTRLVLQGIVCYTFLVYCRAVLCKGRWLAKQDGGIVKAKISSKTIPQPPSASAPFTQGSLWFVRSESLSVFPDKHCFCGHKSEAPREQKLGYNVIKALKSSVSLIGSKQRLLFKHRMKSSISVISESVTGCSSSISENSGEVNFIVFW